MKKLFIFLTMVFITTQCAWAFNQQSCTGIRARSLQPTFNTTAHSNTGVQRVVWIPIPCSTPNYINCVRIEASTNPEIFQAFLTAIEANAVITINFDIDKHNNQRPAITSIVIMGY
jgi:hypothetical protein